MKRLLKRAGQRAALMAIVSLGTMNAAIVTTTGYSDTIFGEFWSSTISGPGGTGVRYQGTGGGTDATTRYIDFFVSNDTGTLIRLDYYLQYVTSGTVIDLTISNGAGLTYAFVAGSSGVNTGVGTLVVNNGTVRFQFTPSNAVGWGLEVSPPETYIDFLPASAGPSSVPEPGSAFLMAAAGAGCWLRHRLRS